MRRPWNRAAVAVGAIALMLSACTGTPSPSDAGSEAATGAGETAGAPRGGTLTVGAQLDNNSFDTAALEIGNRIQYWQPVYDTLVHLSPVSEPQPGMATEWSYNDDNTVLTLTLRDGISFTDGTPFDGEAVKANIEHLRDGTGQNSFMVKEVTDVVVGSPNEVELHLSAPVPALVTYLGLVAGAMASPQAIAAGTLSDDPVGSGPYVLDAAATVKGTSYVYTRNLDYWDADAFPFDEVVVMPMTDLTPRLNALKTGQINAALLSPQVAAEAESSGVSIHRGPVNWFGLLLMDRDGSIVPELADVRVRQAINYAIDKEGILEQILLGYGEPSSQVFGKKSEAFVEDLDAAYPYDPERAKALIEEAGATGMTITIPESTAGGPYSAVSPIVKQELEAVGINFVSIPVAPDQIINEIRSGKYPAGLISLGSASAWQDIQTWITPDAPWNPLHAEDPELSDLIGTAQFASDDDRTAAFQDVNRFLVDNAWFAPFFRPDNIFGTTSDVTTTMQAGNAVPFLSSFAPAGN